MDKLYKVTIRATLPTVDGQGGQEHLMVSRNRKSGTQMLMIPCLHKETIELGRDLSWKDAKALQKDNKGSEVVIQ